MSKKDTRLILTIVVVVVIVWLLIQFLSSVPLWVWLLLVAILFYLNWPKIKRTLKV